MNKIIELDRENLPRHIAFIVDGNRRWAEKHNMPIIKGHRRGAEIVFRVIEDCIDLNIEVITFYLFSTENWKRTKQEVTFFMHLGAEFLKKKTQYLHKRGVRIKAIGRIDELKKNLKELIHQAEELTKNNRTIVVNLAINYGGRVELVDAVNRIFQEGKINNVDEKTFSNYLYTAGLPDPDLLVRTSGEYRISNFLLWQIAYSEIVILHEFWPDFSKEKLYEAIKEYQTRKRRWGK